MYEGTDWPSEGCRRALPPHPRVCLSAHLVYDAVGALPNLFQLLVPLHGWRGGAGRRR